MAELEAETAAEAEQAENEAQEKETQQSETDATLETAVGAAEAAAQAAAERDEQLKQAMQQIEALRGENAQLRAEVEEISEKNAEAIVEEACRIADAIVKHLQDSQSSVFSQGAEAIRKERIRQISEEGYNSEHDNQHDPKEFLLAAVSYLLNAIGNEKPENYWPFDAEFFKPKDEVRDAERAGALIAAALDLIYKRPKEKKTKTTKK